MNITVQFHQNSKVAYQNLLQTASCQFILTENFQIIYRQKFKSVCVCQVAGISKRSDNFWHSMLLIKTCFWSRLHGISRYETPQSSYYFAVHCSKEMHFWSLNRTVKILTDGCKLIKKIAIFITFPIEFNLQFYILKKAWGSTISVKMLPAKSVKR